MKRKLLLALSITGIGISSYLAYAKLTNNPLICGLNSGCDVVQASPYSTLFGVPLGVWGMSYYFVLFASLYAATNKKFTNILMLWGLTFSFYLTFLEAFVINAYCLWCVASFINIVVINLIWFFYKPKHKATNI